MAPPASGVFRRSRPGRADALRRCARTGRRIPSTRSAPAGTRNRTQTNRGGALPLRLRREMSDTSTPRHWDGMDTVTTVSIANLPDEGTRAVAAELTAAVDGEVRFDMGSRATYSTDASNYRQMPIGVVVPTGIDDVISTVAVCHRHGVPITSRGGGTSLAGQATNTAVVIDFSKYLNRVVAVDPDERTAVVEPGCNLDVL